LVVVPASNHLESLASEVTVKRLFPASVAIAISVLYPGLACAQASRTWVSGIGDDANPCSRTSPCKTFAGAISKTVAGGEINCLDPGGYGALTITKSITISCEVGGAGVFAPGTNGIVVNAATTDVVTVSGLDLKGHGSGLAGISFVRGAALHVQRCRIAGFRGGSAAGILFAPPEGTTGLLFVSDTIITENGTGATGGGIILKPVGTGIARASLTRMSIDDNSNGIQAIGSSNTGRVEVFVIESTISGNSGTGVHALNISGGNDAVIFNNHTISVDNGVGYLADGAGATVVLNNSAAHRNGTGVKAVNGGKVASYKNNSINSNLTSDGAPNALVNMQ
jgi:hypothetical protein